MSKIDNNQQSNLATQKLLAYKKQIDQTVKNLLKTDKSTLSIAGSSGLEFIDLLLPRTCAGKTFRGSLYLWMCTALGTTNINEVLSIAAALEIAQTGLVIHDDIMDKADTRRGLATIHTHYAKKYENAHFGTSMGILLGDICYFLIFSWVQQSKISDAQKNRISALLSKELLYVGSAQADDVKFSELDTEPTSEEILTLYRYKTARYTFSLPLIAAAITTKHNQYIPTLSIIGEHMGLAYQLRDDLIDLNGTTSGKPLGADIRENKKTYLRRLLLKKIQKKDKKDKINNLFGNKNISSTDISYVRELAEKYNIINEIEMLIQKESKKALEMIDHLALFQKNKNILTEFIYYLIQRKN